MRDRDREIEREKIEGENKSTVNRFSVGSTVKTCSKWYGVTKEARRKPRYLANDPIGHLESDPP